MIRIDVKAAETLRTLETYGENVSDGLMETLRYELEGLADENYARKSVPRGGLGTDGIAWGPHSEGWAKHKKHDIVGYYQGHLRSLVRSGHQGDVVFIDYVTDYAEHFDKRWPILPDQLPEAWAQQMGDAAIVWMEDELQQLLAA